MTTVRGKLVAGRVKMMENVYTEHPPPVTLCSKPAQPHQLRYARSASEHSSRQNLPLRPAPATPQQPRLSSATPTSARAGATTAEESQPLLLPTHDNLAAAKMAPLKMMPCSGLPFLDSARAAELAKPPGHEETTFTVRELPPPPPGATAWGELGDYLSAVASRIQSSSPVTVIRANLSTASERLEKTIPTKRREFKLSLLILLSCLLFLVVYRVSHANETELDKYFQHLDYSPDQLLVYRGETLQAVPKEGVLNENRCIVIERRKQSVSNGRSEVGVVASIEHSTFPGALLLANRNLMDNAPDPLAVDRAPLTYTVNLPGLTKGSFTITPTFSEYQAAVNEVLATWFDDYPSGRPTAANFHSVESFAYSKQLLRVKFGLDFIGSVIESGIDFDAMARGEKSIKIYKFTQVFYTVSVEPTKRPSDLFDSSVTLSEIKIKTDEKNPPVLVDSVSYGRNIYVKIETTSVEKQAELNLSFMDDGLRIADDLKDLDIQIYVVGGHTNHTKLIHAKETNEVHDIITKFSQFSKHNLGFPISYSSQFIKDNKKAIVHLSTDYVESVRHDYCRKSVIKLIQRRWFCKWEVTWTEYSYGEDGTKVAVERGWDKNSRVMKLPFESEDIEIPSYVQDLRVVARAQTILDSWRTAIDRSDIPIIPRREFYVHGDSTSEVRPPIAK